MKENKAFTLIDVLLRFKKRIVLIAVITIISTLTAYLISEFVTRPLYEARAGIIAEMPRQDQDSRITDITMYANVMGTYVTIARTNAVASEAASKIKGMTAGQLLSNLTVAPEESTMIMYISLKNTDPDLAYRGVKAYANAFMERAEELLPDGRLTLVDQPARPAAPISPNKKLETGKGFFIGFTGSLVLAYLLEELKERKKKKQK